MIAMMTQIQRLRLKEEVEVEVLEVAEDPEEIEVEEKLMKGTLPLKKCWYKY